MFALSKLIFSTLIASSLFSIAVNANEFDCRKTGKECVNMGKCIKIDPPLSNQSHAVYNCQCQPGYNGQRCELTSMNCDASNCNNNGLCVQNINSNLISCYCNPGYYGTTCSMTNLCLNSKCQNGGTCFPIANVNYFCKCPEDLEGSHCERYKKKRPCKFNMCRNEGECIVEPDGLIRCLCQPGYMGNACEINTALCQNQTCNNRGVCQSLLNEDYSCLCDPLYAGKDCEFENVCKDNICLNHGMCHTVGENVVKCHCKPSFTGERCEFNICEVKLIDTKSVITMNSTETDENFQDLGNHNNSLTNEINVIDVTGNNHHHKMSGLLRFLKYVNHKKELFLDDLKHK